MYTYVNASTYWIPNESLSYINIQIFSSFIMYKHVNTSIINISIYKNSYYSWCIHTSMHPSWIPIISCEMNTYHIVSVYVSVSVSVFVPHEYLSYHISYIHEDIWYMYSWGYMIYDRYSWGNPSWIPIIYQYTKIPIILNVYIRQYIHNKSLLRRSIILQYTKISDINNV